MKNDVNQNLDSYLRRNIIFVLILLAMLFMEFHVYNNQFITSNFFRLSEKVYDFTENETNFNGFINKNGIFIAENHDPNITFDHVDTWLKYIKVSCTNANPDAISQVFYRKDGEGWTEENSIIFPLTNSETFINLPSIKNISDLRLDLTNKQGDILTCSGVTLNPAVPLNFSLLRTILFIVSIIGLLFCGKVIPLKYSNATWNIFISNSRWLFIVLLIYFNLNYPLTVTFDSAHYLWLADLIRTRNFANWDPFRTVLFPLKVHLSLSNFGYNQIALLLPMLFAHIILYILGIQIVQNVIKTTNDKIKIIINFSLFIFIALDPTIFGYYHALLTEYLVASIAMISCFLAIKIYHTHLFSKKFFFLSFLISLLAVISWHVKQPYIGAALFPFLLSLILILIRDYSSKTLVFGLTSIISILLIVFVSNSIWNSFLESQNNPMDEDRVLSMFIETNVEIRTTTLDENIASFFSDHLNLYFRSINLISPPSPGPDQGISLSQGFQNDLIAHRMYKNSGTSNMYYQDPFLDQYSKYFINNYDPPRLMNPFFLIRIRTSHFLFTVSYLLIPFIFVIATVYWMKKKHHLSIVIIILSGTSLLNALAHLLVWPIDRYLFFGYPLNLLIILILVFCFINFIHRRKNVSSTMED